MTMRWMLAAGIAVMMAAPIAAQSTFGTRAAGVKVGGSVAMICDANGANCAPASNANALAVAPKQEVAALATANVAAAAQTVYGGDYLFGQSCTGYGTVSLQVLSVDGSTFQTLVARTAVDTTATGVALGSGAVVRVDLSGTTGCVANLSRVP